MNIVSRRNMLALPVERLVGNSHNNHHHSSSRSRLSLSPDSDSSISGESISSDSRSVKNANSHESHKSHHMKGHHGDILQNNISMSPPPRPSSRETCNNSSNNNYSLSPTNCKTHHNPPSTKESNPNNNDDDSDDNNDDYEDDYHKIRTMNNTTSTKDPYYRSTATTTSHINSRSKSPKTNKNIKNSERTCCNSPAAGIEEEVAKGEMRNSNTMNTNANTDITIVKSEVDTDDRFPKEPSNNTSTLILRDIEEEPIHIDDREEDEGNNNKNSKSRSDKFNEEMSANVNNKNSTKEEDDDEVQVDDNDSEDDTNNRVTSSKVDNSWTSGPRSNSPCYIRRDHRVSRNNNEDNERTEGTNNSSFDNEDPQYRHNHIHNHHHVNNHYHNNSDNTSVGRPPSRPSSSTSSTSSNSFNHKSHLKQQHNNNSNSNFLKFSIADILRPDFGINNTPTSAAVNKLQSPRINGQVFNPFFNITSSESRFHHQKYVNTNATIIAKSELPSPSLSSSSVLSLKNLSKPRNGSVSSTDGGHRPYRPSSVHCHSEDSNSSSISRLREEVVDDTKVNPPVPKGPLVWPAWVYCTRYSDRPSSGPRSRRIRKNPKDVPDEKRPRTAFTGEQLSRLKQEFDENRYLTEKRRQDLARDLKLHENQIKIWFQNKRAKLKKSTGTKNGLAQQLMAQGLYNHSTVPIDEDDEMEMGSMMGMGMHMMQ